MDHLAITPDLVNDEEEYKVGEIRGVRRHGRGRGLQFLVHWKGYSDAHDSWEPISNLQHASDEINDYRRKHPNMLKQLGVASIKDKPMLVRTAVLSSPSMSTPLSRSTTPELQYPSVEELINSPSHVGGNQYDGIVARAQLYRVSPPRSTEERAE